MDWKTLARDEYNGLKLGIIISIGYAPEKIPLKQEGIRTAIRLLTKKPAQIMTANGTPTEPEQMPEWFNRGINAVLACPTAINTPPVVFDLTDGVVSASMPNQRHLIQDYDLGISKLHFELAADLKGTWELGQPGRFIVSE